MRLDAKSGVRGMLLNAVTNQPIRFVRWAEIPEDPQQEGEFEAFSREPKEARRQGIPLASIIYRQRCRLRFVPVAPLFAPKPTAVVDLAGSLEEGRQRFARARPILLIPGLAVPECDEPLCHRPALWSVSDEQEIEPEIGTDGKPHERAVMAQARNYCSTHYREPTFTNQRGVQSAVPIEEARPQ